MAWLASLFGKSDPMRFRGKALLDLGRSVPSEAFLIQELTIAKAATVARSLSPEDGARTLAKAFAFYCLTGTITKSKLPTPRYVIVRHDIPEILGRMPGPYPDLIRDWVKQNFQHWFSEYGA